MKKKKLITIRYNKNLQNELDLRHAIYKYFSEKYFIFEKNGKGKEYDYEGGLIFEGEYLNGERFGRGKEYYNNNIIFEGGKGNRKGKKYNNEGKLIFDG